MGQERHLQFIRRMSAYPPMAAESQQFPDTRFGPKGDVHSPSLPSGLRIHQRAHLTRIDFALTVDDLDLL